MSNSDAGLIIAALGIYIVFVLAVCVAIWLANAIGWMKLLTAAERDYPWALFVPFFGSYVQASFLCEEVGDPKFEVWFLTLYNLLGIIPILGPIILMVGPIVLMVLEVRWLYRIGADAFCYVCVFLFPFALPFVAKKYYA